jgi:hypothetical protein
MRALWPGISNCDLISVRLGSLTADQETFIVLGRRHQELPGFRLAFVGLLKFRFARKVGHCERTGRICIEICPCAIAER